MTTIPMLQRRVQRYELADGLRELQGALFWLWLTVSWWLLWDLPHLWLLPVRDFIRAQGSLFAGVLLLVVSIAIPVLVLEGFMRLANRYVRERWLWRSTGVVTSRRMFVSRPTLALNFALVIALFLGSVWLAEQRSDPWLILRALLLGSGWSFALTLMQVGWKLGFPRYLVTAALGALLTLAALLFPITIGQAGLLMGLGWAAVLIGSGAVGLATAARAAGAADAS